MAKDRSSIEKSFELPDGQVVIFGKERFQCSEALFKPGLLGQYHQGIQKELYSSVTRCDPGIRQEILSNVVLSGGQCGDIVILFLTNFNQIKAIKHR